MQDIADYRDVCKVSPADFGGTIEAFKDSLKRPASAAVNPEANPGKKGGD